MSQYHSEEISVIITVIGYLRVSQPKNNRERKQKAVALKCQEGVGAPQRQATAFDLYEKS